VILGRKVFLDAVYIIFDLALITNKIIIWSEKLVLYF
jgi:hypothetical protein